MDPVAPPSIVVRPCPARVGATPGRERARATAGIILLDCGLCLLLARASGGLVGGKVAVCVLGAGFFLVLAPVVNYVGGEECDGVCDRG